MATATKFRYPFAAAPDIIRSNQKDGYFQGLLVVSISNVLRNIYGASSVHRYTTEIRTLAEALYLACTTLIGNRTLGEEYCDIIQVENDTLKLPSILRRTAYILSSVLLPYVVTKWLPRFRSTLKIWLESSPQMSQEKGAQATILYRIKLYMLQHLTALTSPAPIYAVGLSIFYFSGAYYHISKRICGLRYIFTKRVEQTHERIGYEVLGVLLVVQLTVQAWLHIQNMYDEVSPLLATTTSVGGGTALVSGGVEVKLGSPQANDVLFEQKLSVTSKESIEAHTMTPVLPEPRYQLSNASTMQWIEGRQQRQCTLCLEELKDPSATTCGHVFCWTCVADWIREKPECPLCRQSVLPQHVLPLRE